jgi:hypothetical protein
MSDVPVGSVRFQVALAVAAVVGWVIGSSLGAVPGGAPAQSSVPPSASATLAPSLSPSPTPSTSPSSPASLAPPLGTILELSGTGDKQSESFTVVSGWQIVWQTDGGGFAIAVRGDQDLGTIVNQDRPASGATSLPSAGTFHLGVTAKGPWSLKVLQGEAPPAPSPSPS